jgi:hypothetical protein
VGYRVVVWGTGNVGRHAIAGVTARPDLELAGVWVSSAAKAGRDAGELAGLGRRLGVTATQDADALVASRPDCVVHTAMTDNRLVEAVNDLRWLHHQPTVLFDIMGFGTPLDHTPLLLAPGVLTSAWGSVVRQLAAGLDVTLDGIEEHHERLPAPETFPISAGTIEKGTAAALRFEVRGMRAGRPVLVVEHVTRLRDDLGQDWPQPAGQGCYRVEVHGEPNYTLDLRLLGTDGDHNTAGLKATAMALVNAVPSVVEAAPGLLTALTLPPITGRGLVSKYGSDQSY